jgi:hypothetical protein
VTITDALFAKNGEAVAVVSKNTNARATKNASEMSYKELIEALINACDKEIASNNATKNS